MKSVLTIAGADPSGGAGIQADLRTFAALGLPGWSVTTAQTVQNTQGVQSVHPTPPEVFQAQLDAVFSDTTELAAIKVGMLADEKHVFQLSKAFVLRNLPPVVIDPVLASTGGVPLLSEKGRLFLGMLFTSGYALVTPNLSEAAALTGLTVEDETGIRKAAHTLLDKASAVLVKGGHLTGAPIDYLFIQGQKDPILFPGKRVETPHTHGTGCLLSSAIAGYLARGLPLVNAVGEAKQLLTVALRHPAITGRGRGYPDALAAISELSKEKGLTEGFTGTHQTPHEERMARLQGLYVLTDPDLRPERSPEEIVRAALNGGANVLQLREKRLPTPELIKLARQLGRIVNEAGGLFIVNDRVDVALASDADGVHLGPDDMSPADARRLMGPDKIIGVSVSTVEEAIPLAPYASYLGVGAIYGSTTKGDAGAPIGTERIREIKRAFPHIPVVAIGGIGASNIAEVVAAGADSAAVVSAVVCAPDMTEATARLISAFSKLS